jgi:hypothetical protein
VPALSARGTIRETGGNKDSAQAAPLQVMKITAIQ